MSLYRHVRPLLSMRAASAEGQIGPTYVVIPSDTDATPDHALGFRLLVQVAEPAIVVPPPGSTPPPPPCFPHLPVGSVVPRAPLPAAPNHAGDEAELEEVEAEPLVATVVVETSVDRKRWVPIHEPIDLDSLPVLTEEIVLGPYVRARTVVEGEHQIDVHLLGSGSYRLELA